LIQLHDVRGHEFWVEFPFLKKLFVERVYFDERNKTIALSPDAFPSLERLNFQYTHDPFHREILEGCQRESSSPIKRIKIRTEMDKNCFEALLMVPVEELDLDDTGAVELISSDIPWSEEKIITKTLKKFKWLDSGDVSIAFLINCKQLESLELGRISSKIDLSPLSSLPLLKELSFNSPARFGDKLAMIKDSFRSAVVLPSLQQLELRSGFALSRFEGLENFLPNLRILVSSTLVTLNQNDDNVLNSFLYLVRNFPNLQEIRFPDNHSFNTRIPRLLKQEKPSLVIYYPETCQYELAPGEEVTRRDREGTRRNRQDFDEDSDEETASSESPPRKQKQKQTTKKQTKRTTANTKKPKAKKAVPKKTTTAKKKKQKAKVEKKKKKPAGKKTPATPKGKKIAPAKKVAKKKNK
jgi:hypothetical protein